MKKEVKDIILKSILFGLLGGVLMSGYDYIKERPFSLSFFLVNTFLIGLIVFWSNWSREKAKREKK